MGLPVSDLWWAAISQPAHSAHDDQHHGWQASHRQHVCATSNVPAMGIVGILFQGTHAHGTTLALLGTFLWCM
jgi:hypothetical protein